MIGKASGRPCAWEGADRGFGRPVFRLGCPLSCVTSCAPLGQWLCLSGFMLPLWQQQESDWMTLFQLWEGSGELFIHFCGYGNERVTSGVGKISSCPLLFPKHNCCVYYRASQNTPEWSSSPGGLEWQFSFQRFSGQQWPPITYKV